MRIVYLMSGAAHAPYLVVSLHTLRRHWGDDVAVFAFPESADIVKRICDDPRLDAVFVPWEPSHRGNVPGKNLQFTEKIEVMRSQPDTAIYLDADTTVHNDPKLLWLRGNERGFCATQFNDWVTTGRVIKGRIARLEQFPELDQTLIKRLQTVPHPSVNGGIFAVNPDSPVLSDWLYWTLIARSIFIPDETALHGMVAKWARTGHLEILTGGKWNASPKYQAVPDKEIVIQHYHGDSNVRPNKSPRGVARWVPLFKECLENNVGGLREWCKEAGNARLNKLMVDDFIWC